jgi:hypothetical protein
MSIDYIIKKMESKGYKITRSMQSNDIIVTDRQGFTKSFPSYNRAYKYYFSNIY